MGPKGIGFSTNPLGVSFIRPAEVDGHQSPSLAGKPVRLPYSDLCVNVCSFVCVCFLGAGRGRMFHSALFLQGG